MAWTWPARTLWPPPADDGTATITAMPVLAVVALVLSAAVFEEILYRGHPIERLTELTGRRWVGLPVTVPLFVGTPPGHQPAHPDPRRRRVSHQMRPSSRA